jgi:hypothetical protein
MNTERAVNAHLPSIEVGPEWRERIPGCGKLRDIFLADFDESAGC